MLIGLVYNIIHNYRDLNQVRNPFTCCAEQPSALTNEDLSSVFKEIIEAYPSLYLDEMQQKLSDVWEAEDSTITPGYFQWLLNWSPQNMISRVMDDGQILKGSKNARSWGTASWSLRLHHGCAPLFGSGTYHVTVSEMFRFSQKYAKDRKLYQR